MTSATGGADQVPAPPEPDSAADPIAASPTRIANPALRFEAKKAMVWVAIVGLAVLSVYIASSLLVIFGAFVFASLIDGGARLLGRVLPIARKWRIALVLLLATAFFVWLASFAGSQISQQAAQFPTTIYQQAGRLIAWLREQGFAINQGDIEGYVAQAMDGIGTVTRAIGGIFGGLTTLFLIMVIGIYLAVEPHLYERGSAWMIPADRRESFYETASRMGEAMRRLMAGRIVGMVFEGLFTYALLAWWGVPMAALLAILTGLLAFIPNIGALISGALMVLVGFSVDTNTGLFTIFVYFFVQTFDGYVIIPLIAKKTVDLAPGLVLAMQLIMGVLFGLMGLFLADPLLAMIKVALERRSEENMAEEPTPAPPSPQELPVGA
ncbi:AI-2E family transporter [Qipengyuania sp. YIM B01966]|uniref:AI-2E family transporter n=1 Tax=Qipengyuania sp. YIM B01966 TaxID=2778646 RepID=UPI0018F74580|nr:AI-2E family transporter [Qipengyuania sp. YIM B01966]